MQDEMLSIGQISKIVDISTDALRYYDEIDLLKPSFVDKTTKYRYYTEQRLNQLTREKDAIDKKLGSIEKKIMAMEGFTLSKSVLIVDDAPFMNNTLKEVLERSGYTISAQAYNGKEAAGNDPSLPARGGERICDKALSVPCVFGHAGRSGK